MSGSTSPKSSMPGVRLPRLAYLGAGFGAVSFALISAYAILADVGDPELNALYKAQVAPEAYLVPACCFTTAFCLNLLTMLFERDSQKFQLAFLGAYIQLLAGANDYISYVGLAPFMRGWSASPHAGLHMLRNVMWALTTPAMVYLLSLLSDFGKEKVALAITMDLVVIVSGLLGDTLPYRPLAMLFTLVAFAAFPVLVHMLWHMFEGAIAHAPSKAGKTNLKVLRLFTVGFQFVFPTIYIVKRCGFLGLFAEEWLWGLCDVCGKVVYSSSLMFENFVTLEQRRIMAMHVVEASNRIEVIKELRSLVDHKEQFLSSMSHELRTPLNGIIGLSDALLVGSCGEIGEQVRKTLATIKNSGARLLNLINDIIDASAMRQGKLTIKHERVSLPEVVDDVVDLCRVLAKPKVRLVNSVPRSCPAVLGDTGRIIQILHNLIGNACKFTHHGTIRVDAALVGPEEVQVSVSDTGIGIPGDSLHSIFEAFEQVDMSTTRKYGGTGLGLSIVKQLVEAHGAQIKTRSTLGEGTTFTFSLKAWDPSKNADFERDRSNPIPDPELTPPPIPLPPGVDPSNAAAAAASVRAATLRLRPGPSRNTSGQSEDFRSGGGTSQQRTSGGWGRTGLEAGPSARPSAEDDKARKRSSARPPSEDVGASMRATPGVTSGEATTAGEGESGSGSGGVQRAQQQGGQQAQQQGAGEGGAGEGGGQGEGTSRPAPGKRRSRLKGRVLSVDDDPVNQMVLHTLLTPEGYEVLQAMNGQEALQMMAEADALPDLILLDVMMPGMSGYEVCRKLRELYPTSCIPIIMVSAKRNEEHIVEGLSSGSNDYIVKPFGRQEILARVAAHLKFRDSVYRAGEEAAEEDLLASWADVPDQLMSCLSVDNKHFSLPTSIKSQLENMNYHTNILVFNQLTMVVAQVCADLGLPTITMVSGLHELARSLAADALLGALASLYIYIDELLAQHRCYLVDGIEGRIVAVAGLAGEEGAEQLTSALGFARGLLASASRIRLSEQGATLELSVGVHSCATQGVIVGVNHPVLKFMGNLHERASRLQSTCPPNCIHVSASVYEQMRSPQDFVLAVDDPRAPTYLVKAGSWQERVGYVPANLARYLSQHPFGPLNTSAPRMRPIQLALMSMVAVDAGLLLGLMTSMQNLGAKAGLFLGATGATISAGDSPAGAAARSSLSGSGDNGAGTLVVALQHDKEVLGKQLEEVEGECLRLQTTVDSLELELQDMQQQHRSASRTASAKLAATASATAATDASFDGASAELTIACLEQELAACREERQALLAGLVAAEGRVHELAEHIQAVQSQVLAAQAKVGTGSAAGPPSTSRFPGHNGPSYDSRVSPFSWQQQQQGQQQQQQQQQQRWQRQRSASGSGRRPPALGAQAAAAEEPCSASSQALAAAASGVSPSAQGGQLSLHRGGAALRQQQPEAWASHQHQHQRQRSPGPSWDGAHPDEHEGASSFSAMRMLLEQLGMPYAAARFDAEEITPGMVQLLHDEALKELGVHTVGSRLRLRMAADVMQGMAVTQPPWGQGEGLEEVPYEEAGGQGPPSPGLD